MMLAPLSIVIPTLNAAGHLPETAAHLKEGFDTGLVRELVISDGNSSDTTASKAHDLRAIVVNGDRGRGGQLRRGADKAVGDWLLFLHADTHLSPGWNGVVRDHIRNHPDRAGYFRLKFRADGFRPRFFEFGANLRARIGLPYGDQGLLISRILYDQIDGYADIPLMEDVSIVSKLKRKLTELDATASTDPIRYETQGWYRRGVRNVWTLIRYRFGVSSEKLLQSYER